MAIFMHGLFPYMIQRSKERVKKTAEVFTPLELVDEMLSKLPKEVWKDPSKTFLDNSAGDGNFIVRVIAWKIKHGSTVKQALETTYAVELMADNVAHMKERIYQLIDDHDETVHGIANARKKFSKIIDHNIVCSDAFKWDFENWKPKIDPKDEKQKQLNNLLEF